MRDFISSVALLVKVTARMLRYSDGAAKMILKYSSVKANVLPEPAEALQMSSISVFCGYSA